MSDDYEKLAFVLTQMGATQIDCELREYYDESVTFTFGDKKITISGQWTTDGTGGLHVEVEESCA